MLCVYMLKEQMLFLDILNSQISISASKIQPWSSSSVDLLSRDCLLLLSVSVHCLRWYSVCITFFLWPIFLFIWMLFGWCIMIFSYCWTLWAKLDLQYIIHHKLLMLFRETLLTWCKQGFLILHSICVYVYICTFKWLYRKLKMFFCHRYFIFRPALHKYFTSNEWIYVTSYLFIP